MARSAPHTSRGYGRAVSIQDALTHAPSLGALASRAAASVQCLARVAHLLPATLLAHVQAGPLEGGDWCVIVANSAVAAKLRQFQPILLTALQAPPYNVTSMRIKVQTGRTA
jgi:hypothetical protein